LPAKKKANFIDRLKLRLTRKKKTNSHDDVVDNTKSIDKSHEHNYTHEMKKILKNADKYGIMSDEEKSRMSFLIRKNGSLPTKYRRKLWILASGSERTKRNNPGYYIRRNYHECSR